MEAPCRRARLLLRSCWLLVLLALDAAAGQDGVCESAPRDELASGFFSRERQHPSALTEFGLVLSAFQQCSESDVYTNGNSTASDVFRCSLPLQGGLAEVLATAQQQLQGATSTASAALPPSAEYIVRFHGYRPVNELRVVLEEALGEQSSAEWQWVERNNPAMAFPTDFALVRIADSAVTKIRSRIESVGGVRDVSSQRKHFRQPLSTSRHPHGFSDPPVKGPGRLQTASSFSVHRALQLEAGNLTTYSARRKLMGAASSITSMFQADKLWSKGYSGKGVRMAVFDTGIRADHPHFKNIKERTNWTHENTLNDGLGHGTFVAGVIAGQDNQCHGFAVDTEIYAFRVFTTEQVSYTSWFLDAFNYAVATEMNILNLSIGGPDYLDRPFVEKVWEISANNIIMVSAIGNDGPLYGTLNNPADQMDVIGVGGIDYSDHIASFSSRGMSTWELPVGYGRVKPDIVAYGRDVMGSKTNGGCRSLSGTSVASPVVAGAVCLLASVVPESRRWQTLNPASMKQALVEGAARLAEPHIYEQGVGRLNVVAAEAILQSYVPRASILPASLDLTDCPYMWPFCRQPLYAGAMPLMFNATILNGMGVTGWLESPPVWEFSGEHAALLDVQFTYPDVLWPWSGYLGLYIRVKPEGATYAGTVEGRVTFTVVSQPQHGETQERQCSLIMPIKAQVIPTPPRHKRILWDQYHNVRYPPGYIPRDSLDVRDILDWHGDHPHTNYHGMYDDLRDAGYFVEILGSPFTCFDARDYGVLMLVDLEDEYHPDEIVKLQVDVVVHGLSVMVFADWYNVDTMVKMRFFDDNTRSWWTPATGGANIPAINDLLAGFGIAFGDNILNGQINMGRGRATYAAGVPIIRFPAGGMLHSFALSERDASVSHVPESGQQSAGEHAVLGLWQHSPSQGAGGRVVAYGDSNCLDSSHQVLNCYWLLRKLLEFCMHGSHDAELFPPHKHALHEPLGSADMPMPLRRTDVNFSEYSQVLGRTPQCLANAPLHNIPKSMSSTRPQPVPVKTSTLEDPLPFSAGALRPLFTPNGESIADTTVQTESAHTAAVVMTATESSKTSQALPPPSNAAASRVVRTPPKQPVTASITVKKPEEVETQSVVDSNAAHNRASQANMLINEVKLEKAAGAAQTVKPVEHSEPVTSTRTGNTAATMIRTTKDMFRAKMYNEQDVSLNLRTAELMLLRGVGILAAALLLVFGVWRTRRRKRPHRAKRRSLPV
eukprot:jgi/Chlat1/7738/Chrsp66S07212